MGKADFSINGDTKLDASGFNSAISKMGGIASKGLKIISGATVAAAGAVAGLSVKAIDLASDLSEVQNVVDTTFGKNAGAIDKWAKSAATAFGLSELQAKQYTGTMGAMLKSMGLTDNAVKDMSTSMVGLAGDFASFYNLDAQDAFDKIRSGISGETEPLKQLGINMSVANLEAFALSQGINKAYKEMTQAEQATLRYNYLMSVTKDAQGDFAKTSDSLANQLRIAQLNIKDLGGEIGKSLLPMAQDGVKSVNELLGAMKQGFAAGGFEGMIKAFGDYVPKLTEKISSALPDIVNTGVGIVKALVDGIVKAAPTVVTAVSQCLSSLITGIGDIGTAVLAAVPQILASLNSQLPQLINLAVGVITNIINGLIAMMPSLITTAMTILTALVNAVGENIPTIVSAIIEVVPQLINALIENIPALLNASITFLMSIVDAMPEIISELMKALPNLIDSLIDFLITATPQLVKAGIDLYMALVNAIPLIIPPIMDELPQIINSLVNGLIDAIPMMIDVGGQLINGLWEGVKSTFNALIGSFDSIVDGIVGIFTDGFDIHSPSRRLNKEVGRMLPPGVVDGAEYAMPEAKRDLDSMVDDLVTQAQITVDNAQSEAVRYSPSVADINSGDADDDDDNKPTTIIVPVSIDGREVARTTAKYTGKRLAWEG